MAGANLISLELAKLRCNGASTSDDRTIDEMIKACSDAIRKYCKRDFVTTRYDELCSSQDGSQILLRNYPILAVESVRCQPTTVLEIKNTNTSTNQQARVAVTRDGLELTRTASGTLTRDTTVTWSSYATLQAVATAVSAITGGWLGTVVGSATGDYGLWPSADLFIEPAFGNATQSQGALDCRGKAAGLKLHITELSGYCWDPRGWLYWNDPWADTGQFPDSGRELLGWRALQGYYRVQYTAGYQEVPASVAEAAAEWTAILWNITSRDPLQTYTVTAGGSSSGVVQLREIPLHVKALIDPYKKRGI